MYIIYHSTTENSLMDQLGQNIQKTE